MDAPQRIAKSTVTGIWLIIFLPLLGFPFLVMTVSRPYTDVTRRCTLLFFDSLFAVTFWFLAGLVMDRPSAHVVSLALHLSAAWCTHLSLTVRHPRRQSYVFTFYLLNPLKLEATLWPSGLQELLFGIPATGGPPLLCRSSNADARPPGQRQSADWCSVTKETAVCFILLLPAVDLALFRMRRGRSIGAYARSRCCSFCTRTARAGDIDRIDVLCSPVVYF